MRSQDEGWLIALMKRHPWCQEWLGVWDGTPWVIVQYTPSYSPCLTANLLDGGHKPFIYKKCIYSKHNILSPLHVHMWELIQPQIHRWVAKHTIVLQNPSSSPLIPTRIRIPHRSIPILLHTAPPGHSSASGVELRTLESPLAGENTHSDAVAIHCEDLVGSKVGILAGRARPRG